MKDSMKAFVVQSDGEGRVYIARTFSEAYEADYRAYREECGEECPVTQVREEHNSLVEQISFIGEIANAAEFGL